MDHAEAEAQSAADVVAVPDAELLLRRLCQSNRVIALQPGMTATAQIITSRKADACDAVAKALRVRTGEADDDAL